jgi:hypothetical protein
MGLVSRMLQSLILIDALSSTFWEKKERQKQPGRGALLSQGGTCFADCVAWDFHGC